MKEYVLYEIEVINDIPMWRWVCNFNARNIVDAEFQAEKYMVANNTEHIITLKK